MEIPSITTKVPSGSRAYVFGSYLRVDDPSDLDLLVVYSKDHCTPSQAYSYHQDFIYGLHAKIKLRLDVVVLSEAEERELDFIKRERCVEI